MIEAGAESGDLTGVDMDGSREFLVGQATQIAVGEPMFEGGRNEIRRRLRGAGKVLGIVLLVGVNDTARPLRLLRFTHWGSTPRGARETTDDHLDATNPHDPFVTRSRR